MQLKLLYSGFLVPACCSSVILPNTLWLLVSDRGGWGLYNSPSLSPGGVWLWYWWFPSPYSRVHLHPFLYFLFLFMPCSFCTDLKCHIKSQFTTYGAWVILGTCSLFSLTLTAGFAQLPKLAFLQLTTSELFKGLGMPLLSTHTVSTPHCILCLSSHFQCLPLIPYLSSILHHDTTQIFCSTQKSYFLLTLILKLWYCLHLS